MTQLGRDVNIRMLVALSDSILMFWFVIIIIIIINILEDKYMVYRLSDNVRV